MCRVNLIQILANLERTLDFHNLAERHSRKKIYIRIIIMKYQSVAVRLKLTSSRVLNLLQRIGFDDPTLTPIALTHKIYTEEDFNTIKNFYHRIFTELAIPEGLNPMAVRREYLTENLKLSRHFTLVKHPKVDWRGLSSIPHV